MTRVLLILAIASSLRADRIELCVRDPYSPRVDCQPPITFTDDATRPPFDVRYRFVRAEKWKGQIMWLYAKDSAPSRPCTITEASKDATFAKACNARIGDELAWYQAFRIAP